MLWRYIFRHCLGAIAVAALALVALFFFIEVIDALEDVGDGSYTTGEALRYAASTVPRLLVSVLPVAAVIGALAGLGGLAGRRELAVMQVSGLSTPRLASAALAAGALAALLAVPVAERLAPAVELVAEARRSAAIAGESGTRRYRSRWVRDGHSFARVEAPRLGGSETLGGVSLYEFDADGRLRGALRAASARWQEAGGKWRLREVARTRLAPGAQGGVGAVAASANAGFWRTAVTPAVVDVLARSPERMSFADLRRYTAYRARNQLDTGHYELALAKRVAYPFTTVAMVLIAVPLVLGSASRARLSSRVAIGAVIGVAFHTANEMAGLAGLVYQLPAWLAASAMTALVALVGLWMLWRET